MRESALRESPRTPREACFPKKNRRASPRPPETSTASPKTGPLRNGPQIRQQQEKTSVRTGASTSLLRVASRFVCTENKEVKLIGPIGGCAARPSIPTPERRQKAPQRCGRAANDVQSRVPRRSRHGRDGRGRQGTRHGAVSASSSAAVPSRHQCDSRRSDEVVGGLFFNFEAVRRCSPASSAPARRRS